MIRLNYLVTFKTLSLQQPSYLYSLLTPYNPTRSLRSSHFNFLTVPRVSTALQSRSFSVAAPHLWNSLRLQLRLLVTCTQPFRLFLHNFQLIFSLSNANSKPISLTFQHLCPANFLFPGASVVFCSYQTCFVAPVNYKC